ncbi:MAG: molybdopterin biosynthesis protein [Desulfarculaceae bacterium]|nr:molybdopterin biosynthesis protein [Desulfarculaceae bacterium]
MGRNIYLNMKSMEEAKKILFDQFGEPAAETETIRTVDAAGRILAEPAVAAVCSPNFHAAAMDGIAVDAAATFGTTEDKPRRLTIGKDAFWINTGHVMPADTNAVIMIEHLNPVDDQSVIIEAPAFPWQNVRKMGEDIVATELLFARNTRIDAYAVGALLSGGVFRVTVMKQPRVLIIPTGSELKQWRQVEKDGLEPGDVVQSNAEVLAELCREYGAVPQINPMIRDDLDAITDGVREAAENRTFDMILIIGGSSAGSMDYARPVIETLGTIHVHGVTMMPGKPLIIGSVNDLPVFGIPGYPVSAIVAFEQFAGPLAAAMQKYPEKKRQKIEVIPARKIPSKLGQEEFLRVKIGSVDGRLIASQLPRGAGSITTLTEADGIIRIPADREGISRDEPVQAELIKPLSSIENTVVVTGSHDNTLDILSDLIRRSDAGVSLSSTHVGSMGGITAVRKGACHMAGVHLLDPEDGSYNISYVEKYLKEENVRLVNLVMRDQGLMVPAANPKGIKGLEDLKREDLFFINRQPGSGTRILLDYRLDTLGIDPADIKGYENEEYTHMSVAAAVLSGRADAGLGINAAARALGLDFIPVVTEQYDLVIPERFIETAPIQAVLETIRSEEFKTAVRALGGYGTDKTGEWLGD